MNHKSQFLFLIVLALAFEGSRTAFSQANHKIKSLHFLDEYIIPNDAKFQGTVVGGISGLDYDANTHQFYMLSDDRSSDDSARFYTAKLIIKENAIDTILFTRVVYMLQPDGTRYPSRKTNPGMAPDPESIRLNSKTNELIWTNEGERWFENGKQYFIDPAVHSITPDGKFVNEFSLAENLKISTLEKGPRRNGALEGAAFGNDFRSLYVAMEEPLYQDGERITDRSNNSFVRIFVLDAYNKKTVAQYAYQPERVAYPPNPQNAYQVNGISEILEVGTDELLIIERSFSVGRKPCTVKLFLADVKNSQDVSTMASLREQPPIHPIKKKLLLNLDDLGIFIDNVEGVSWGPMLANGHRSLILVTDNNFAESQKTQVLLFEVGE